MKKIFFMLILSLAMFSCNKDYTKEAIDSDILVAVEKVGNKLFINAETEREYGSTGYGISFKEKTKKGVCKITFKKIIVPNSGLHVMTPATASIDISHIDDSEVIHEVFFYLAGQENTMVLKGKDGEYWLEVISNGSHNVKIKQ